MIQIIPNGVLHSSAQLIPLFLVNSKTNANPNTMTSQLTDQGSSVTLQRRVLYRRLSAGFRRK